MTDKDFIREKINLITRDLERLKIFSDMTFGEIVKDYIKYAAVKNFLMEIIGRGIDINEHLIANLSIPEMDVPKTYKDTFLSLAKFNILPADFAQEISKSAGFRNAIVHEYNDIVKNDVYKTIGEAIKQYTKYCDHILKFCENI